MTAIVEIIWDTHGDLLFRDVHEKWHKEIKDFMFEKYFQNHRLFNEMKLREDPNVDQQYLKYLDHILKDECSMVAIHKDTREIKAVAMLKCMSKEWHSWTALKLCIDNCKFSDIIEMQYRLVKEYGLEYPEEPFDSLHLFEYYIADDMRFEHEFVNKFFNALCDTARHFKMPRVTFMALSIADQDDFYDQGYDRLSRAIYSIYRTNGRCPFAALRAIDEMEADLFEIQVIPIYPYHKMKVRSYDHIEITTNRNETKKKSVAVMGSAT